MKTTTETVAGTGMNSFSYVICTFLLTTAFSCNQKKPNIVEENCLSGLVKICTEGIEFNQGDKASFIVDYGDYGFGEQLDKLISESEEYVSSLKELKRIFKSNKKPDVKMYEGIFPGITKDSLINSATRLVVG